MGAYRPVKKTWKGFPERPSDELGLTCDGAAIGAACLTRSLLLGATGEAAAVVAVLPCLIPMYHQSQSLVEMRRLSSLDCAGQFNKRRDKFQFFKYEVIISPDSRRVRTRGKLSSQPSTQYDSISKLGKERDKKKKKKKAPLVAAGRSFVLSQIQAVLLLLRVSQLSPPHARNPSFSRRVRRAITLIAPVSVTSENVRNRSSHFLSLRKDQKKVASIAV